MDVEVIEVMAKHHNICKYIHLPVQSGSTRILQEMNRQHTREEYIALVDKIYEIIPDISLSQDMISGFPTETEEDHQDTLKFNEAREIRFRIHVCLFGKTGNFGGAEKWWTMYRKKLKNVA